MHIYMLIYIHFATSLILSFPNFQPPFLHVDFDRCTMDGDDDANGKIDLFLHI